MSNKNSISYHRVDNYLIPNLILPPEKASITIAKLRMMYKDYFVKYKTVLFNSLLIQGKLYQHISEAENQARNKLDNLVEHMKESEGVTKQLKKQNQWEWVQRMGNI